MFDLFPPTRRRRLPFIVYFPKNLFYLLHSSGRKKTCLESRVCFRNWQNLFLNLTRQQHRHIKVTLRKPGMERVYPPPYFGWPWNEWSLKDFVWNIFLLSGQLFILLEFAAVEKRKYELKTFIFICLFSISPVVGKICMYPRGKW